MKNKTEKLNGTLKISQNAIISIAEAAAAEIKGVALTSTNKLALVNKTNSLLPPVKIKLSGDTVSVEITIIITPQAKAADTAKAVQNNVKAVIQSMTGITVSKVNVTVAGISAEKN